MKLYWLIFILNIYINILICICMCIYMYICIYSINILLINLFLLGWFTILPCTIWAFWTSNLEYILSKPRVLQGLFILASFLSFCYYIIMWKKIWNLDIIQDDYIKLHLRSLIPSFLEAIGTIIGIGITMYFRGVHGLECNILPIFLGTLIVSPYSALLSSNLRNWYKPEVFRPNNKISLGEYSKSLIKSTISLLLMYFYYDPISQFMKGIHNNILNNYIYKYIDMETIDNIMSIINSYIG